MLIAEFVPLAPYTTLKVGGTARYFAEVTNEQEVRAAFNFAREKNVPVCILGGGSNLLVPDEGYEGLVIHVACRGVLPKQIGEEVYLTVGAGEVLDTVIADTVEQGWWGLENLSAIPGSVGAAPVQNVGAYGVEAKDVIDSVVVFDQQTGTLVILSNAECQFAYRDSIFKHSAGRQYVVMSVTFRLSVVPRPVLTYKDIAFLANEASTQRMIRETVISIRREKFPDWTKIGTAGSFFKNPIIPEVEASILIKRYGDLPVYDAEPGYKKISLGYVLDKVCNLRGYTAGNVSLYERQALVLVATSNATANEVITFAMMVQEKVFAAVGINIEWEVVLLR